MKRTTRMNRAAWVVLALPLVAIATTFQNCSKVDFATTVDPSKTTAGEKTTMYQEAVVGQANVPPLKLVFIVDNSFTMQANQISLASAFGSMFAGSNATNLAPFDSTAYIFTTAQISPDKSVNPLLPTLSFDDMKSMKASDLMALRGPASSQVDGKFTGDLVSYSLSNLPDPVTMLNRLSYVPSPVLGISATGATPVSLGVHKDRSGSVADFAADFSERISYISPTRARVDSTGKSALDPVIDKESGLCALARVLKNNSNFLNKGDLAAYVIVSDEDDNDPSGQQCLDAIQDMKDADLIDTHCETPRTKISYNAPNSPNASCAFNYQKGFTYEVAYDVPQTKIEWSDFYHLNTNARTKVTYKTSSYKYTNYKYDIAYYVSNPTYKLKQVDVSWFTKSTSCKERDGVKYDCVDSFAPQSRTVEGTYTGSNCSSFSSVYAGAVTNDAAHPIKCAQAAPRSGIAGACPTSNANAFDCDAGYTAQSLQVVDDSSSASCSTLTSKLPGGALKSGVAAQYLPSCGAAVAQPQGSSSVAGFCANSGGKPGCVETYLSSSKDVSQVYSASTCQAAVDSASLPANAIKTVGATNGPTCAANNYNDSKATLGKCASPLPANVVSCVDSTQANAGVTLSRRPSSTTCAAYASSSLSANADASSVKCTDTSTTSKASTIVTFNTSNYVGLNPKVGDLCPADLTNSAKGTYGSTATCKITAVDTASKSYSNTCADNSATIASFCSGAVRNCTSPVDNGSNAPYQASVSNKTVNGTITCDTKCSDAYGACGAVTTGLVKDAYFNCSATPDTVVSSNSKIGVLSSMKDAQCSAPSVVKVDKSYQRNGSVNQPIAGKPSADGDPNALINYIKERSKALLGDELPATSVFVSQANGGKGQTEGRSYKAFASAMGGSSFDVGAPASTYASSLQMLSGVIKDKLARSFSIQGFDQSQVVTRAWFRAAGTSEWVEKQEGIDWTASGGTVTVSQALDMKAGDSFRFEYK